MKYFNYFLCIFIPMALCQSLLADPGFVIKNVAETGKPILVKLENGSNKMEKYLFPKSVYKADIDTKEQTRLVLIATEFGTLTSPENLIFDGVFTPGKTIHLQLDANAYNKLNPLIESFLAKVGHMLSSEKNVTPEDISAAAKKRSKR